MDKNTITAIILSTLVVLGAFILQPKLFPNAYSTGNEVQLTEVASENVENTQENKVKDSFVALTNDNKVIEEKEISFSTDKIDVVLSNKGGDIVSYKLKEHIDVDTNTGVEMVDNVSEINRACAVAFGNINSSIRNDLFNVTEKTTEKGEKVYFFTKKFSMTNEDGTKSDFIFGKKYTFLPDEYMFKLEVMFMGEGIENLSYTLRTSPQIGPHFNPKLNRYENRQFISFNGKKAKRQIIGAKKFTEYNKEYIWNGIGGKYFVELMIPEKPENMNYSYYSTIIEKDDYSNAQAILVRNKLNASEVNDVYYVYFGPRDEKTLRTYNTAENNKFGISGYRLNECLQTNGWLGWLETILKWMMEFINKFVKNWGVSIIIMTLIIKIVLFPLTKKQLTSSSKMQELQPQIKEIQRKYADNPQKQQQEMAALYQKIGYNPVSGCLPMVLQFLLLWSMYNLFNTYFEFRGASFIHGWISDLSSGDSIHTFVRSIPFFGNQLRILPIIYLASQLLYGKITGMGGTAAPGSTQAQMNMMMYGMPIVFFFIFYNAPSGLLLYWTVSNILQMVQQVYINKFVKNKPVENSKIKPVKKINKNTKKTL